MKKIIKNDKQCILMRLTHLKTLSLKSKIKGLDIESELFWF
jgi:hypothetical protein